MELEEVAVGAEGAEEEEEVVVGGGGDGGRVRSSIVMFRSGMEEGLGLAGFRG